MRSQLVQKPGGGETVRHSADSGLEIADGGARAGTKMAIRLADIKAVPRQFGLQLQPLGPA